MRAAVPEALRRGLVRPDPDAPPHEQFHAYFVPDPGEVEEQEVYRQKMLRLAGSLATLSQPEREYAFNLRRVEAYSAEHERISALLRSRSKKLAPDRQIARDRLPAIRLQLEEALRDTGELQIAKKFAINGERRKKLDRAKKAVERPDSARCRCKDPVVETPEGTFVESRFLVIKRVFSKRHLEETKARERAGEPHDVMGAFPYLIECRCCGFRNATHDLPELLLHERRVLGRHSPEALAKDATLRTKDAEVFRRVRPRL